MTLQTELHFHKTDGKIRAGNRHAEKYKNDSSHVIIFPMNATKRANAFHGECLQGRGKRMNDLFGSFSVVREVQPETEKILGALQGIVPEKTIIINDIEYIYIYRIADIPEAAYEALQKQRQ